MKILLERTDETHSITMPEIIEALASYDISTERKSLYISLILKLFGEDYAQNSMIFLILIGASISVLLLRTPFGYLLASKGKSSYNLMAASISIITLLVLIKPIIYNFGLEGVAWLSFINLLFIGIFQMISYFYLVYRAPKL